MKKMLGYIWVKGLLIPRTMITYSYTTLVLYI